MGGLSVCLSLCQATTAEVCATIWREREQILPDFLQYMYDLMDYVTSKNIIEQQLPPKVAAVVVVLKPEFDN